MSRIRMLVLIVLNISSIFSQQVMVVSGGEAKSTEGSIQFTVGELGYTSVVRNDKVIVVQGIQNSVVLNENKPNGTAINVVVYPNPTVDFVNVEVDFDLINKDLHMRLIDLQGKELYRREIDKKSIKVSMKAYLGAVYLLGVFKDNELVKTIKIFKY